MFIFVLLFYIYIYIDTMISFFIFKSFRLIILFILFCIVACWFLVALFMRLFSWCIWAEQSLYPQITHSKKRNRKSAAASARMLRTSSLLAVKVFDATFWKAVYALRSSFLVRAVYFRWLLTGLVDGVNGLFSILRLCRMFKDD